MTSLLSLIDWIRANDPALSRLRQGLRVMLTVILSTGLLLLASLLAPLPKAAFGLALLLSIQSGISVKDARARDQLVTRLLGALTALLVTALAALLESNRLLSDAVFLLVTFLAVALRGYGVRGHAIGMFGFMAYFIGAYLQPPLTSLPAMALGAFTAAGIGHVMRVLVLPDDPRRDLLRASAAIEARLSTLFDHLDTMRRADRFTPAGRRRSERVITRLREAVLMAASFLPTGSEAKTERGIAEAVTIALFDLHVAAESAIVLARQAPPPPALMAALRLGDAQRLSLTALRLQEGADPLLQETIAGVAALDRARRRLKEVVVEAISVPSQPTVAAADAATGQRPQLRWSDPTLRTALQITIAAALAMALGQLVSRERWFWAVLSAFLVFTNTRSRGDTALKALQRSVGTVLGIGVGLGLATLLGGHPVPVLVLAATGVFFAFYLLPVSYAAMAFFVSVVVALVYSLIGALTVEVLLLRLEETVVGSLAGLLTAFLVFPTRTAPLVDQALFTWTGAVRSLIEAAKAGERGFPLVLRSQAVERAMVDLARTAAPLGASWRVVTRPGTVRQTLAILMSASYWSRVFAGALGEGAKGETASLAPLAGDCLAALAAIEAKGSAIFSQSHGAPPRKRRHFALSERSPLLGLDRMTRALARLDPDDLPQEAETEPKDAKP